MRGRCTGGQRIFKLVGLLKWCLVGRRVRVGRVQGLLPVCLVDVDCVFDPFAYVVSDASLFFGLFFAVRVFGRVLAMTVITRSVNSLCTEG